MNALVLVDIQNDFLPGGALAVPQGDRILSVIDQLQTHFDHVIATRDWHPPEHGSFAANHPGRKPGEVIQLGGYPQILWPVHCVQGTPGAQLAPALDTTRVERIFSKGIDPKIDSYSGFFDQAAQRSTGLEPYLRSLGVDTVYVVGLATDYCVKATAADAVHLGFKTSIIVDACRGVDLRPGDSERALAELRAAGVELLSSDAVLEAHSAIPVNAAVNELLAVSA